MTALLKWPKAAIEYGLANDPADELKAEMLWVDVRGAVRVEEWSSEATGVNKA